MDIILSQSFIWFSPSIRCFHHTRLLVLALHDPCFTNNVAHYSFRVMTKSEAPLSREAQSSSVDWDFFSNIFFSFLRVRGFFESVISVLISRDSSVFCFFSFFSSVSVDSSAFLFLSFFFLSFFSFFFLSFFSFLSFLSFVSVTFSATSSSFFGSSATFLLLFCLLL